MGRSSGGDRASGQPPRIGRHTAALLRERRHEQRRQRMMAGAYAGVVVAVIGAAVWLLWLSQVGGVQAGTPPGVVAVDADMSGFSKTKIEAKVGEPVTIRLHSLDTSFHTDGGGKHQLAIDEFGVNIIAQPKGTQEATFTPTKAGTFQFYCDICCGGKANPTMQGELVVSA